MYKEDVVYITYIYLLHKCSLSNTLFLFSMCEVSRRWQTVCNGDPVSRKRKRSVTDKLIIGKVRKRTTAQSIILFDKFLCQHISCIYACVHKYFCLSFYQSGKKTISCFSLKYTWYSLEDKICLWRVLTNNDVSIIYKMWQLYIYAMMFSWNSIIQNTFTSAQSIIFSWWVSQLTWSRYMHVYIMTCMLYMYCKNYSVQ